MLSSVFLSTQDIHHLLNTQLITYSFITTPYPKYDPQQSTFIWSTHWVVRSHPEIEPGICQLWDELVTQNYTQDLPTCWRVDRWSLEYADRHYTALLWWTQGQHTALQNRNCWDWNKKKCLRRATVLRRETVCSIALYWVTETYGTWDSIMVSFHHGV